MENSVTSDEALRLVKDAGGIMPNILPCGRVAAGHLGRMRRFVANGDTTEESVNNWLAWASRGG